MKHAVALVVSLLLILGDGVFPRSAVARLADAAEHACGMAEQATCTRCACCVAPANGPTVPLTESSPAQSGSERLQLPAGALYVLYELSPDCSLIASPARFAPLPFQPVPLFQRHCLLLI